MLSRPFSTSGPHAAYGGGPRHWQNIGTEVLVLVGVAAIASVGGVLGHVLGTPQASFILVTAILVWSVGGWFVGGWRAALVGGTALGAALAASDGAYAIALLFAGVSFLLVFLNVETTKQ